jgi:hypothetical protein
VKCDECPRTSYTIRGHSLFQAVSVVYAGSAAGSKARTGQPAELANRQGGVWGVPIGHGDSISPAQRAESSLEIGFHVPNLSLKTPHT